MELTGCGPGIDQDGWTGRAAPENGDLIEVKAGRRRWQGSAETLAMHEHSIGFSLVALFNVLREHYAHTPGVTFVGSHESAWTF